MQDPFTEAFPGATPMSLEWLGQPPGRQLTGAAMGRRRRRNEQLRTLIAVKVGNPPRGQEPRVPRRHHPVRRARAGRATATRSSSRRTPGVGSSIPDEDYVAAGATILDTADDVWGDRRPDPQGQGADRARSTTGCARARSCSPTCTWPPTRRCTEELVERKVTGIAYETVELPDRSLPLLAPMSEVAGRLAPQVGAHHLMRAQGGRGVLMGGVSGVYAAKVVVIGAGVSGMNAAAIALGMQAEVLLLDRNIARLRQADAIYQGHCQTVASNAYEVERAVMRRRPGHRRRAGARRQGARSWSPTSWSRG